MNRREFLANSAAGAAAVACRAANATADSSAAAGRRRFRLDYAPHFGMFRHHGGGELLDQIRFMADEGFRALEDNGLKTKPVRLQERIRAEMDRHGLRMGVFVGTADFGRVTFASARADVRDRILREIRRAVSTAKRTGARWFSIVPGKRDPRRTLRAQTADAVATLRRGAELCEPAGVVMLLEPIHHGERNPHLFLHSLRQAHQICRAVGSPACKVLFDCYHQHLTGGRPIETIDRLWNEVGYVQVGDNPGRKEPGTGNIDYRSLFRLLRGRGYNGIVGMEHGNALAGKEGERAVIAAYDRYDPR